MSIYIVAPVVLLLIGLVLFLPNWNPKVVWIGKVLTCIALIVLALGFVGTHYHHLIGKWPS
jgi:hypothetical protein